MADVHTKETRSYNMSRIRSKDTKPEMLVRRFLFSKGFRYRLHDKKLPGKPDIVLPKYKTAIFIHGCFWHGHAGCRYYVVPKTRTEWWENKIGTNKAKDSLNHDALIRVGYNVQEVWECELRPPVRDQTLNLILEKLKSGLPVGQ